MIPNQAGSRERRLPHSLVALAKRPIIRRSIFLVAIVVVALLPAFTLAPETPAWVPAPLQLYAYDTRLLIGRSVVALSSLKEAVVNDPAVTLIGSGESVSIENNGTTLAGTLFTPSAPAPGGYPAILLLHGSTPQGRHLGLYRLLGQELAETEYMVLTIDQRGYGESSDPQDMSNPASFDFVGDVQAALAWIAALPDFNGRDLYLIGHSFGGDVALAAAAADDSSLDKLVLIGPGRRFSERGGTPDAPEFDYFRRREMRYMLLDQAIPADTFIAYRTTLPIENHHDYLAQTNHVPVLLVDGALEGAADQAFLTEIYADISGTKAYVTLPQANHYANVANLGALVVYDEDALAALIEALVAFLQS